MSVLTKQCRLDGRAKVCVLLGNQALPDDLGEIEGALALNDISRREWVLLYP